MRRLDAEKAVSFYDGVKRRDFLQSGALGFLGLSMPDSPWLSAPGSGKIGRDRNCIFLLLVGGPSHVDLWDMKPQAPAEIRGPFKPIRTNVPGIEVSEILPRMARHADKYALIRSMHHTAAAVHDAGQQMMQTGRLFDEGKEHPHLGCVVAKLKGPRGEAPAHVLLPTPIVNTGGNAPHGQTAGFLGREFDPCVWQNAGADLPRRGDYIRQDQGLMASATMRAALDLSREEEKTKDRYGRNRFGMSCLRARRMIESGVRFVTVNMFDTVFNELTWDIHGTIPFSPISAYRDVVGPMFDLAYSALLSDLADRGMLDDTLVVATGEFGRTPQINPAGGRDHWTNCWTMLMAGGGVRGGQVIGASDKIGAYPKERPVTPAEIAATICHSLGIDPQTELTVENGRKIRVVEEGNRPVLELF